MKRKTIEIEIIREAIANYMQSEGWSCCAGREDDRKKIAELLDVPMYHDESGYDFGQFVK